MKLGSLKRVMMSDVPGAEPWFQTFLNHYNPLATQVMQTLGQQVSITDNTNCSFMDVDLFQGVERIVKAPVPRCAGVVARMAASIVSGKPTRTALAVDLSVREIDGVRFGLTARFPVMGNYAVVQATAVQSIARVTDVAFTYAATPVTLAGSAISYNGTDTLTANEAGIYDVTGQASLVSAAGGTRRASIITAAPVATASIEILGSAVSTVWATVTEQNAVLAAGDTRRLRMFHNQTAAAPLNTISGPYPRLSMRMVDRLTTFKARVNCLFLGA